MDTKTEDRQKTRSREEQALLAQEPSISEKSVSAKLGVTPAAAIPAPIKTETASEAGKASGVEPQPAQDSGEFNSASPYAAKVPRTLLAGLSGFSYKSIARMETEGLIKPYKSKRGNKEVVSYTIEDAQKVIAKRGKTFKKRDSAEVIAVFSQKGGTGKSAFSQHTAALLSLVGRVLVIDLDSQADTTTLLGLNNLLNEGIIDPDAEADPTILELMDWTIKEDDDPEPKAIREKMDFDDVVKKISPTLHVIPSDLDLNEVNYDLNHNKEKFVIKTDDNGRPKRPAVIWMIRDVIEQVKDQYDFILMDMPPNIEAANVAALFAANRVLMPFEIEPKCLWTLNRNIFFLNRLKSYKLGFNWDRVLAVGNKYRQDSFKMRALTMVEDLFSSHELVKVSQAVFPHSVVVDKCSAEKEPVFFTAMRSGKEHRHYVTLAKEFTDLFWVVIHELLDVPFTHFIFRDREEHHAKEV